MVEYRQIAPPAELQPWVECFWTMRGSIPEPGQVILPDGRIELIFQFQSLPAGQPALLLAGQMMTAVPMEPCGFLDTVGVRLRPAAGGALLPQPASLTGSMHEMDAVLGAWCRHAQEEAGNQPKQAGRVAAIMRALARRVQNAATPDAAIAHSIRLMGTLRGSGSVDEFLPGGLQTRQWQRRFASACGVSPKAFTRILKLQLAIALYRSHRCRNWAEIAVESGFYDQAHLTNAFRRFTGASPLAFFQENHAKAEFFLDDAIFQDG